MVRVGREMLGQMLADRGDGAHEAVAGLARADMLGEVARRSSATSPSGTFCVDGGVGQDLGEALGDGDEDQHAGAPDGGVQVLRQELLDRAAMGALACLTERGTSASRSGP